MSARTGSTERNIELSFAFAKAIVDDPTLLDEIPNGVTLVLLPDDDPDLAEENLKLAVESARAGVDVYIRHVRSCDAAE